MRKLLIGLAASALFLAPAAFAQDKKTVEGELVDTYCYSAGGAKGAEHASCGTKCAKSGIPVAVVVNGKAMTLATNPRPLAEAMSKQVRVTGDVNADSNIIVPDTVQVKEGDQWKDIELKDAHHSGAAAEEKKESASEEKNESASQEKQEKNEQK